MSKGIARKLSSLLLLLVLLGCSGLSLSTPTSTPTPSLTDVANDMLIAGMSDEKSLISEYYPYIDISEKSQDLVFSLLIYPDDPEESLELATDIIFNGALAIEITGDDVRNIVVEYVTSSTHWIRFYVSSDYMANWLQRLEEGNASLDSLYDNLNYEISATPTPSKPVAPSSFQFNGRSCISWRMAGQHVGEYTCVYGIVTNVHDSSNASFINFGTSSDAFYLVSFDYNFEGYISDGDCIAALGSIQTYNGTPQIVITYADTELKYCK